MSLCDSSFLKQTNMCRPSCVQVSLIAHVACRLIHRLQLSAVCDSREGELVVSVSPLIVEAVVWPCVSVTQEAQGTFGNQEWKIQAAKR